MVGPGAGRQLFARPTPSPVWESTDADPRPRTGRREEGLGPRRRSGGCRRQRRRGARDAEDRARGHVARVVHARVDARVADSARQRPERNRRGGRTTPTAVANATADAVCPDGNEADVGIRTCRSTVTRAASRSGRARRTRRLPSRLAEADATAIAPTPTSAARRGRFPPSARVAAMPNEILEWSAACDRWRSVRSRVGVGVAATAAYRAPSTALRSPSTAARSRPGPPVDLPPQGSGRGASASVVVGSVMCFSPQWPSPARYRLTPGARSAPPRAGTSRVPVRGTAIREPAADLAVRATW